MGVFSLGNIGHPCCCGGCNTIICVTGCGANIVGATVTIKSGATVIGTCTTVAGGCCTITIPSAGTYTVVVSAAGWTTNTSSHSLTCGGTTTISMGNPPAGTICCGPCPIPTTLTLTDSNTTISFVYNVGAAKWVGSYTISTQPTITLTNIFGLSCTCVLNSPGTARVCYSMQCISNLLTITLEWEITNALAGASNCSPPGGYTLLDVANDSGGCDAGLGGAICPSTVGGGGVAQVTSVSVGGLSPTTCVPFSLTTSGLSGGTLNPTGGTVSMSA